MTIEQLCELSAFQLEQLTDEQLLEYFKPFLTVTRPELVVRKPQKQQEPQMYLSPQKKAALEKLGDLGVDMSFMRRKKK